MFLDECTLSFTKWKIFWPWLATKIAEEVKPPAPVLKVLTLMSNVLPKAKLFPQKDLAELAFRDLRKRKMVCPLFTHLIWMHLHRIVNLKWLWCCTSIWSNNWSNLHKYTSLCARSQKDNEHVRTFYMLLNTV